MCGEWKCTNCFEYQMGQHLCYQRKPLRDLKNVPRTFFFYNFETTQNERMSCKNGYVPANHVKTSVQSKLGVTDVRCASTAMNRGMVWKSIRWISQYYNRRVTGEETRKWRKIQDVRREDLAAIRVAHLRKMPSCYRVRKVAATGRACSREATYRPTSIYASWRDIIETPRWSLTMPRVSTITPFSTHWLIDTASVPTR